MVGKKEKCTNCLQIRTRTKGGNLTFYSDGQILCYQCRKKAGKRVQVKGVGDREQDRLSELNKGY